MALRHETDAAGGRVALKVGGALNSGHIPVESEANAGASSGSLVRCGPLLAAACATTPATAYTEQRDGKPRLFRTTRRPRSCGTASSILPWPSGHRGACPTVSRFREARRRQHWSIEATMDHSAMPGRNAVKRQLKDDRFQVSNEARARFEQSCFR